MDLSIITNNSALIIIVVALGFTAWKLIIEPRANEGQPIDEDQEDLDT